MCTCVRETCCSCQRISFRKSSNGYRFIASICWVHKPKLSERDTRGDSIMEGQASVVRSGHHAALSTFTTRDLVAMGFRHRRALLISFFAVLLATAIAAEIMPRYEAHTEILVHRERPEPVVSPQQGS